MALKHWGMLPDTIWGEVDHKASALGQFEALETLRALIEDVESKRMLLDLDHAKSADPFLYEQGNAQTFADALAEAGVKMFFLVDRDQEIEWWPNLMERLCEHDITVKRFSSRQQAEREILPPPP